MLIHTNLTTQGSHLFFAGANTVALAEKYGTPLYLLDEERIRARCRAYIAAMKKYFGGGSGPLFASKALCFTGIYRIMAEEGMSIDVVSPGEIYTAKAAGFPLERAYFHGNNKTDADIAYAIESGVGVFVVDNLDELSRLDAIAGERGVRQDILLRITPGIDPHTHKAVVTGNVDSKFGAAIETGQAMTLVKSALDARRLNLIGFHCHVGSQIFDTAPFTDAATIMLRFIADVKSRFGYAATTLNLGGGFGVRYVASHPHIDIEENIRLVADYVDKACRELNVARPRILMEPGRSIVADAGLTLYTVGSTKVIPGFRQYVSIDGGMPDNPRYALYQSPYTVYLANRMDEPPTGEYTVAGRCCESGDLIQEGVPLPAPKRGDIVAVAVTGAYNYAMASNYNRIPRPAIVMIKSNGEDVLAVRRETYEDLCKLDVCAEKTVGVCAEGQ